MMGLELCPKRITPQKLLVKRTSSLNIWKIRENLGGYRITLSNAQGFFCNATGTYRILACAAVITLVEFGLRKFQQTPGFGHLVGGYVFGTRLLGRRDCLAGIAHILNRRTCTGRHGKYHAECGKPREFYGISVHWIRLVNALSEYRRAKLTVGLKAVKRLPLVYSGFCPGNEYRELAYAKSHNLA